MWTAQAAVPAAPFHFWEYCHFGKQLGISLQNSVGAKPRPETVGWDSRNLDDAPRRRQLPKREVAVAPPKGQLQTRYEE
jgi:hypothetical protein